MQDGQLSTQKTLRILNGEVSVDSSAAPVLDRKVKLTPRELEILHLMAEGLQQKQIARMLNISKNTVHNHIKAIYVELGTNYALGAVIKAIRIGLLDMGPIDTRPRCPMCLRLLDAPSN